MADRDRVGMMRDLGSQYARLLTGLTEVHALSAKEQCLLVAAVLTGALVGSGLDNEGMRKLAQLTADHASDMAAAWRASHAN